MHQLVQTRDPLDEVVVQEEPLEREQRLQVLHLQEIENLYEKPSEIWQP